MITYTNQIKEIDPEELLAFLQEKFTYEIPIGIESEAAMRKAGNLLGTIISAYTYLASALATLNVYTKLEKAKVPAKPKKADELEEYERLKQNYEMMVLRKQVVEQFVQILDKQYNCVSRMITVKIKADEELRMSDSRK